MPSLLELQASNVALVLWALLFVLVYRRKTLYYLLFCGLLALGAGLYALEYAPSLWVPVEFIFGAYAFFQKVKKHGTARSKVG